MCSQPITADDGYVLIMDAESRSYPQRPSRYYPEPKPTAEIVFETIDLTAPPPPDHIAFAAYHRECDPDPDTSPYWIDVERAQTLEEWCQWIHHLCGKIWMSKHDVRRMLQFWFANRGIDMYRRG